MIHILIIGGGLAGCTAALELADNGIKVTLVEKSSDIGGKVRKYGCKASVRCNNCGLCIVTDLWDKVSCNKRIKVCTSTQLIDLTGNKGNYKAVMSGRNGFETVDNINYIIVSIGFNNFSSKSYGNIEIEGNENIISGIQMEKLLAYRDKTGILPDKPENIAFIQCFGSRDIHEKAVYCSRVCCAYSTRTARVLKQYYPEVKITFFYMDLQKVEQGDYFNGLVREGIEFVRCRPVKLKGGKKCGVLFEQPGIDGITERSFNYIVLSEGVHPPEDSERLAEICMFGINEYGFLKYVSDPEKSGIYVTGCASGPKSIEETHSDAVTVAGRIIQGGRYEYYCCREWA